METLLQIAGKASSAWAVWFCAYRTDVQQHPVRHRLVSRFSSMGKSVDKKPPCPNRYPAKSNPEA